MNWQLKIALELRQTGLRFRLVTSQPTDEYNCIGWAMGDQQNFWWPNGGGYWPGRRKGQNLLPTLDVFQAAFATRGYMPCADAALEDGVEKVALFAKGPDITHAARQLLSGFWTSKLGPHADIEHELEQIQGPEYGLIIGYMSRPRVL